MKKPLPSRIWNIQRPPSTKPSAKPTQTNTSDPSSINAYHVATSGNYASAKSIQLKKVLRYPPFQHRFPPASNKRPLPLHRSQKNSETQNLRYMLAHSVNASSRCYYPLLRDMKTSKEDTNVSEQQRRAHHTTTVIELPPRPKKNQSGLISPSRERGKEGSLHNSAIMLNTLLQLRKARRQRKSLLQQITRHVLGTNGSKASTSPATGPSKKPAQ